MCFFGKRSARDRYVAGDTTTVSSELNTALTRRSSQSSPHLETPRAFIPAYLPLVTHARLCPWQADRVCEGGREGRLGGSIRTAPGRSWQPLVHVSRGITRLSASADEVQEPLDRNFSPATVEYIVIGSRRDPAPSHTSPGLFTLRRDRSKRRVFRPVNSAGPAARYARTLARDWN